MGLESGDQNKERPREIGINFQNNSREPTILNKTPSPRRVGASTSESIESYDSMDNQDTNSRSTMDADDVQENNQQGHLTSRNSLPIIRDPNSSRNSLQTGKHDDGKDSKSLENSIMSLPDYSKHNEYHQNGHQDRLYPLEESKVTRSDMQIKQHADSVSSPRGLSSLIALNMLPVGSEVALNVLGGSQQHDVWQTQAGLTAEEEKSLEQKPAEEVTETPNPVSKVRGVLIIACLFTSRFLCFVHLSILAPFFPSKAEEKLAGTIAQGVIYSSFAGACIISAVFLGKYIPTIGIKRTFVVATFSVGIASICFGLTGMAPAGWAFILICTFLRVVEGFGSGFSSNSANLIITTLFPQNVELVNTVVVCGMILGFMTGPMIGSALYDAFGYTAPFLVVGGQLIFVAVVSFIVIPSKRSSGRGAEIRLRDMWNMLKVGTVRIYVIAILLYNLVVLFFISMFSGYILPYMPSSFARSLTFTLTPAVGVIPSFFAAFGAKRGYGPHISAIAILCSAISLLISAPSPIITFGFDWKPDIVSIYTAGVILGFSLVLNSLGFPLVRQGAMDAGFPAGPGTDVLSTGLTNAAYYLGETLGPLIGGVLVDLIGYPWSCTLLAGVCLILILYMIVFFRLYPSICCRCCKSCKCCKKDEFIEVATDDVNVNA